MAVAIHPPLPDMIFTKSATSYDGQNLFFTYFNAFSEIKPSSLHTRSIIKTEQLHFEM